MINTGASLVVNAAKYKTDQFIGQKGYVTNSKTSINETAGSKNQQQPRTRKRKRRPQSPTVQLTEGSNTQLQQARYWRGHVKDDTRSIVAVQITHDITTVRPALSRRKQPEVGIREPLAALEREQTLYELRDKRRQEAATATTPGRDKSYRRTYSQAKKQSEVANTSDTLAIAETKTANDLRNILKNSGGSMSLSEILQQKNLSLDDLLKGKQNALLALQTTSASPAYKAPHNNRHPSSTATTSNPKSTTTEGDRNDYKTVVRQMSDDPQIRSESQHQLSHSLHRLKLFGSSSRAVAASTMQNRMANLTAISMTTAAATRKRVPSTSTTTTTTRLPIYKKRLLSQQQQPTLKYPSLLQMTTKEAPTLMETLTSTMQNRDDFINGEEENVDKEKVEQEVKEEREGENKAEENGKQIQTTSTEPHEDKDDMVSEQKVHRNAVEQPDSPSEKEMKKDDKELFQDEEEIKNEVKPAEDLEFEEENQEANTTMSTTVVSTVTATTVAASTTVTVNADKSNSSSTNVTFIEKEKFSSNDRYNAEYNSIDNDVERLDKIARDNNGIDNNNDNDNADDNDGLENFFEDRKTNQNTFKSKTNSMDSITSRIDRDFVAANPTGSLDGIQDIDGIEDRTDLLELIEDHNSGNRLFKVLEQRNMTLEELIEHRKRGSSQLHLATIVQNRSRFFPGQKVVLHDNMDIVTAFENFPHFNLMDLKSVKPDDIKTDSQGSSYFTSIIDIEPTDEIYKDNAADNGDAGVAAGITSISNNSQGVREYGRTEQQSTDKSLAFYPSWKSLALSSLATGRNRHESTVAVKRNNPFYLHPPKFLFEAESQELNADAYDNDDSATGIGNDDGDDNDDGGDGDIDDVQHLSLTNNTIVIGEQLPMLHQSAVMDETAIAIENEMARAHDLLDLELSGHGFKRSPAAASTMTNQRYANMYSQMPTGIRSAIVASAAIVLTSMATFLVIFVVCRWKQRRHRRTTYMRTYNAMKSKIPTPAATMRTSTKTTTTTTPTTSNTSLHRSSSMSLRNMGEYMSGDGDRSGGIATVSGSTPALMQQRQQEHPTSFILTRCNNNKNNQNNSRFRFHHHHNTTNAGILTTTIAATFGDNCTKALFKGSDCGADVGGSTSNNNSISGYHDASATGSTTSLALSLRSSTHNNISTTRLNTMKPDSPEVQEYLFDTLRKSF